MRGFDPAFFTILAIRAPANPWRANSAVAVFMIFSRARAALRRGRRAGNAAGLTPSVPSRSDMNSPIGKGIREFYGEAQQCLIRAGRADNRQAERTSRNLRDRDRHLRQAWVSGDRVERQ